MVQDFLIKDFLVQIIFTGGHNFHGKYEYVCIQSMEKARDLIVKIAENLAKMNFEENKKENEWCVFLTDKV